MVFMRRICSKTQVIFFYFTPNPLLVYTYKYCENDYRLYGINRIECAFIIVIDS